MYKPTPEQVTLIGYMYEHTDISINRIAAKMGVTKGVITGLKKKYNWKKYSHLEEMFKLYERLQEENKNLRDELESLKLMQNILPKVTTVEYSRSKLYGR